MKHLTINYMVCCLAAFGHAAVVSAHEGSGSLGVDPSATDYHQISCGATSDHLAFQLNGARPATAPTVSAQIQIPDQQIAVNVTDPVNGDVASSEPVDVRGGATVYHLTVGKSGSGKANYSFTYHCEAGSGEHTETEFYTLQNQ